MGSPLRLTLAGSRDPARAWDAVTDEFRAAEAAMTRFSPSSGLTRLNATAGAGALVPVDRRLGHAVATCDRAARVTGGRFDARIVVDLERLGDDGVLQRAPHARGRRGTATRLVRARCRDGRVAIDDPVDLGGIGKGLALRWAATRLEGLGERDFLLDAGGDIVARGAPPDGAWRVAIEDPAGAIDALAIVGLGSDAIATSSVRRRRWLAGGREVHHLIDPATGRPAAGNLLAVTVADRDPAWAEVWSKALFVAGRAAIGPLARGRGLAAWWVADDGTLGMTPAARPRTLWVATETDLPA